MSKLLLDDNPLMVMPQLAKKIGLNEALFLQQIHYWNEINKKSHNNYRDGYHWTYNSISKWQEQFPFWSAKTIQRTINNLEKMKLLATGNYNKMPIDRTKWYRINHDVLSALEQSPFGQIGSTNMTEWVKHLDKLGLPLPEITSEITSKIEKHKGREQNSLHSLFFNDYKNIYQIDDPEKVESVEYYLDCYQEYMGKPHPRLKEMHWDYVIENIFFVGDEGMDFDLDSSALEAMIDQHFKTTYQEGCDYNIMHFMNDRIRIRRMYEVAY